VNDSELLVKVQRQAVLEISKGDLDELLKVASTLRQEETGMAGPIRILLLRGRHIVQEGSPSGDFFLRKMDSMQAGDQFVDDRLALYERIWDGCGCRVHYLQE
jgi:hypothetical protein